MDILNVNTYFVRDNLEALSPTCIDSGHIGGNCQSKAMSTLCGEKNRLLSSQNSTVAKCLEVPFLPWSPKLKVRLPGDQTRSLNLTNTHGQDRILRIMESKMRF